MDITIKQSEQNQRLDIFLAKKLNLSRSKVQKMIYPHTKNFGVGVKEKEVLVNDKEVKAHYLLKENDKIKIKPVGAMRALPKNNNFKSPQFKIVAESDDYLVINKPAGLAVHGGENINEPTLTDALIKKYPEISKVGDDPMRPGIVHRLDKEASGLMVVARTNKMFEHLKQQFQKRQIKKEYTALIYGKIAKEDDEINFPISRSAQGFKMAAHSQKQGGRNAITEFEVAKHFINYTLLKIKTKTGRSHQVRVHMSAYGHPLVGDDLYGTRKTREQNKKLGLTRIFLHADYLGFNDLRGEWQEWRIELPIELKKFLKKIK